MSMYAKQPLQFHRAQLSGSIRNPAKIHRVPYPVCSYPVLDRIGEKNECNSGKVVIIQKYRLVWRNRKLEDHKLELMLKRMV